MWRRELLGHVSRITEAVQDCQNVEDVKALLEIYQRHYLKAPL
jgi:hypothetical protein